MPIIIPRTGSGDTETWLKLDDDGTVIYHAECAGSQAVHAAAKTRTLVTTAEEAKALWPSLTDAIDLAVAEIARTRKLSSG